jgi:hypothetical protein
MCKSRHYQVGFRVLLQMPGFPLAAKLKSNDKTNAP